MRKKKTTTWGGSRPGSGRKPLPGNMQPVQLRLPAQLIKQLDQHAGQDKLSRCEYIRRVLDEHLSQLQLPL